MTLLGNKQINIQAGVASVGAPLCGGACELVIIASPMFNTIAALTTPWDSLERASTAPVKLRSFGPPATGRLS
jgi:hypothetical protein